MITSKGFYYDEEYSGNKAVVKVRTSGGLITESFLSTSTTETFKAKNSIKRVIQNTEFEPLVIPMALYFDENLDETSIREVKKWLTRDDFRPLVLEDIPEKVFYAKLDGASNLTHNAISSGYVEFDFITNSAYSFSHPIDLSFDSTSGEYTSISIYNEGDIAIRPKFVITIDATDPTPVEIYNETTGKTFILYNNLTNEQITVWNEYEEFETSSSLRYCYDDHNGQFIELVEGVNELQLKGNFEMDIEYQNVYL